MEGFRGFGCCHTRFGIIGCVDTELLKLAKHHDGVLLRADALAAGYSSSAVTRRIDDGFLVPVFPGGGAYVLGSTLIERRHRIIAATLLTPGAAADAEDAAVLLGLIPNGTSPADRLRNEREPVRIAVPTPTRVFANGILVRRQLHRTELDLNRRFGIDVLSPERLVLDMAGRWPAARVAYILDAGLAAGTLDLDTALRRHLQLHRRGRKGVRVVDALFERRLGGTQIHATKLERRTREVITAAGFPEPVSQFRVELPGGRFRYIDLAYPWVRIAIEVDGFRWHSSRTDWAADQVRNNELVGIGWLILRVTDETLANPAAFLGQLHLLVNRAA